MAKPARRIFEIALERLGVSADEAVYVDNQPDMTAAARALGFQTVTYENDEQDIGRLSALLEPPMPDRRARLGRAPA